MRKYAPQLNANNKEGDSTPYFKDFYEASKLLGEVANDIYMLSTHFYATGNDYVGNELSAFSRLATSCDEAMRKFYHQEIHNHYKSVENSAHDTALFALGMVGGNDMKQVVRKHFEDKYPDEYAKMKKKKEPTNK